MTKAELVAKIAERLETSKREAEEILEIVTKTFIEVLKEEGEVKIPGIGKLEVKETAPRKGRNPQTGEEIQIPASKRVSFKASKNLKESIK